MSIELEIPKKPQKQVYEEKKVTKAMDVFNLKEVQEIKDAVQEHLLFIGLDRANNVRSITLLGLGTSGEICIDSKYIIRTALISASDKVILVHNHPANRLKPSNSDKYLSNVTNKVLDVFNIEFLDHIIVTEKGYISMKELGEIDRDYEESEINFMNKCFLIEENKRLQEEIRELKISREKEYEDEMEV